MWSNFDRYTSRLFFHRQFFPQGWGDPARLADAFGLPGPGAGWDDADTLAAFRRAAIRNSPPAPIDIAWAPERRAFTGALVRRGTFATPFNRALLPEASRTAHVEWIAPPGHDTGQPVCVLFPATGEQGFLTRRLLALALARQGIASLVLEVAFYGARRPPDQHGALLNHVSDLIALMDTTVEEGRALVQWLRTAGYHRIAVSGISMGGSVSALVAARTDHPLATVSMIPAHAVGPVYAEGLLSNYVAWDGLAGALRDGSDARRVLRDWLAVFDVSNYPRPVAENAARFLCATDDGCIPREDTERLFACWPDARVDWITGGHSSAAVTGWNRYRRTIAQAAAATG